MQWWETGHPVRPLNTEPQTRPPMLRTLKQIYGCVLRASDGDIGYVSDFSFDVRSWAVRYIVASTAAWPLGRKILLDPLAFGINPLSKATVPSKPDLLRINLTRAEIRSCPPQSAHPAFPRQQELLYFHRFGWPFGPKASPPLTHAGPGASQLHYGMTDDNDRHLYSARAMEGYSVLTTDGILGPLTDMCMDDINWVIRELLVNTGSWYTSHRTVVSPRSVESVDYFKSVIQLNRSRGELVGAGRESLGTAA